MITKKKITADTIITTHVNADFDGVASMLAAQKLYPDSLIVFPDSNEKSLRNFLIQSTGYLLNMADMKQVDLDGIKRLVLVDTKQPDRIGKFSTILDNPDLDIHIYDHHPRRSNDVRGTYEKISKAGATVTILTEIIKKKKIDITPDEATVMCLGIYEDTGSFTFSSTTKKDFIAAAFLLSKGANLTTVSNLITREMNPDQVMLLNDLIHAANRFDINGVEIIFTTVTRDKYVADFSFVIHKMIDMEKIDAIIAIAQMDSKLYVVARSRIPEVDVGVILTSLGGGGHAFAASATIKGKTLAQTEQEIIEILNREIKPYRLAKDIMSSPPITVDEHVTCKTANNLLTRYNINALLVTKTNDLPVKEKQLIGFISRQVIEKALFHKLHQVPVKEYTSTDAETVSPDATITEIQNKIIGNKQRILPVIDQGVIIGVVTRTDLLNILAKQSEKKNTAYPGELDKIIHARTRNVAKFMKERIQKRILNILISIGDVATKTDCKAYVVGGFVRDLFLYQKNDDIDIVIEGDGIAFAMLFAKQMEGRVHAYKKFGTAVITLSDGFKIDVASARVEYYKFPAALPTVEMSSIKLDLFRRDFTINTLAIALNTNSFGILIDFFSAQRDLKAKSIRVLHNLSFVEDPTRVFRAIRFEQRFGFSIGKLTSGLIENTVKMDFFKRLSGQRVFTELRLILEEDNPSTAIKRLDDYNLLPIIHPSIKLTKKLMSLLDSVKNVVSWYDLLFLEEHYMRWAVFFAVLIHSLDNKESEDICTRFELTPQLKKIFTHEKYKADKCLDWLRRNMTLKNSTLYQKLSVFKTELILYMMAATEHEDVKKSISTYFTHLRETSISINGKDLIDMGLQPGPTFKTIMQAVFDAKLNGLLKTKKEELAFIRNHAGKFQH